MSAFAFKGTGRRLRTSFLVTVTTFIRQTFPQIAGASFAVSLLDPTSGQTQDRGLEGPRSWIHDFEGSLFGQRAKVAAVSDRRYGQRQKLAPVVGGKAVVLPICDGQSS